MLKKLQIVPYPPPAKEVVASHSCEELLPLVCILLEMPVAKKQEWIKLPPIQHTG